MAGKKRDKDRLREHAGVAEIQTIPPPSNEDDPLRWWTHHPTDAIEIDLRTLAEGQAENPYRNSLSTTWAGPYSGRPTLIAELAPHIRDQTLLCASGSASIYIRVLRRWWRLFDQLEAQVLVDGQRLPRVDSVSHLNAYHEVAAHKTGVDRQCFSLFRRLANAARKARALPLLHWIAPEDPETNRQLISDQLGRLLRANLNRNWVAVRRKWILRDEVRAEVDRRDRGEPANNLGPEGERLLKNWKEFRRIAEATGKVLPSPDDLRAGRSPTVLHKASLALGIMRSIQFPSVWEMEAAIHVALLDSGWNPSTMLNLDANDPNCVVPSVKDNERYLVLRSQDAGNIRDEVESWSMSAPKPRARGKLQTCHGLAKNSCSAPVTVKAYIERTEPLRRLLRVRLRCAIEEHARLESATTDREVLSDAYRRVQLLRQGVRSVWLYLDPSGAIRWPKDHKNWTRYTNEAQKQETYLDKVINQLLTNGETFVHVTLSDLRDLYARRTYRASGGSVLALMLALGHSSIRTTSAYLDNNIFRSENDGAARRFLDILFGELSNGRLDLTIVAQLSRHGPMSDQMMAQLLEYRLLTKSRLGVGCNSPRNPPPSVEPDHTPGQLCGSQRCGICPHARYLPESLDGLAMRAEELTVIANRIPREAWLRLRLEDEQLGIEALLEHVYPAAEVITAREKWRTKIQTAQHRIPGAHLPPTQAGKSA